MYMSKPNSVNCAIDFDKLWNYNKPDETEGKFREILPQIEESGDKSSHLQLLTQIARTQSLQLKFEEAHTILDEVEKLLTDDLKVAKIRYLLERGRTYNSSMQKDKAREFFLRAYDQSVEMDEDFYAVDAAHMMGIVEGANESLEWNTKAVAVAEKSKDSKANKWLGSLYNNTGWTYHDMKEYNKALTVFEKNVKWHTERKSTEELRIAKWCVAKTLRSLNRVQESLEAQKTLLKEMESTDIEKDGYVYEEIAECNYLMGNNEEAKKYFAMAYDLLSQDKWLSEYEGDRLQRLKDLSLN